MSSNTSSVKKKLDAVVIATGSNPIRSGFQPYTMNEIRGWDQPIVCTDQDVIERKTVLGHRVIVADTLSFIEAPGVAEYIAKQGREVEVVTPLENIALELRSLQPSRARASSNICCRCQDISLHMGQESRGKKGYSLQHLLRARGESRGSR